MLIDIGVITPTGLSDLCDVIIPVLVNRHQIEHHMAAGI
jgi:hypothetical protein